MKGTVVGATRRRDLSPPFTLKPLEAFECVTLDSRQYCCEQTKMVDRRRENPGSTIVERVSSRRLSYPAAIAPSPPAFAVRR